MKVLIVCSENSGRIAPFIVEQVDALNQLGVKTQYFTIKEKGLKGYLKSRKLLLEVLHSFQPDLIHAHFGLSGLLANLQRKIPVVTTYHGSDINVPSIFRFSKWSIRLSVFNVFVSEKNYLKSRVKNKFAVIPCGVDTQLFKLENKEKARSELGFENVEKLILFSGAFDNYVKNSPLAKKAVEQLENARLIEMKGFTRIQVSKLMNAVDICLMTSFSEGSPQFIKEAMSCNCPIVSVDVGDVSEVIEGVENCYLAEYDAEDIAEKLKKVFENDQRTNGRKKITEMKLDSRLVAKRIFFIYNEVL